MASEDGGASLQFHVDADREEAAHEGGAPDVPQGSSDGPARPTEMSVQAFAARRASRTRHTPEVPRQALSARRISTRRRKNGPSRTRVSNSPPSPQGWMPRVS